MALSCFGGTDWRGVRVAGIYLFVLFCCVAFYFLLYVIAISERPREDLTYLVFLPLFPFFAFGNRVHAAFSIMAEIFLKSHLDSSMAPWWVLRKTKF
jgi:hypothetical protein